MREQSWIMFSEMLIWKAAFISCSLQTQPYILQPGIEGDPEIDVLGSI